MGRVSKVIFPKGKDLKPVPGRLAPKQAVPAMTVTPAMPENPKTRLALETLAATQMVQQDLQMAVPARNLTALAEILTPAQRMAKGLLPEQLEPKEPASVLQVRAATAMSEHLEIRPLPMEPAELLAFNRQILTEIRQATKLPKRALKRNGR